MKKLRNSICLLTLALLSLAASSAVASRPGSTTCASGTIAARNGMAEIAADNLLLGLEGKPLRCWVNPDVVTRGQEMRR